MSDFYDSEVDTDHPARRSRDATLERPRTATASQQPSPSATNYMQYRSRNILDRGPYNWPTSAPATLERSGRSNTVPRDLYDIARQRRAGSGTDSDRLEDWIDNLLSLSTQPATQPVSPHVHSKPQTTSTQRHVIDTKFPRSVAYSHASTPRREKTFTYFFFFASYIFR